MKRKTKLIFKNLEIPFVEFSIKDGTVAKALVDTGSESTLFDLNFVKKHKESFKLKIENYKMDRYGIGGRNDAERVIHLSGNISFRKSVGKDSFTIMMKDATVSDLSHINNDLTQSRGKESEIQAFFGSDFLKRKKAKINFQTNTLEFL